VKRSTARHGRPRPSLIRRLTGQEEGKDADGGRSDDVLVPVVPAPSQRRRLIIGAVTLFLVVIAVIVFAKRGSDDDNAGRNGGSADKSLVAGGRTWRVVQGEWSTTGNVFRVTKPGPLFASLVVTDSGAADVTVRAEMSEVASGAGLVFRYQDPFNYWALEAVRGVVSWQLIKVEAGKSQVVRTTGFSPTGPGTVVAVTTKTDGTLRIAFNGKESTALNDLAHADRQGAGYIAQGVRASKAVFAGFRTEPLSVE
jgi:hypothetical protein